MDFLTLADQCASFVPPHTLEAIVKTESNFDPLKIGVNGGAKLQRQPVNIDEAVVTAQWLLQNGYNIDLGLGQVNSSNLNRVGLSVTDAFDPCKNLKAAGTIFNHSFQAAMQQYPEAQALQVALSAYNTGNFVQGFRNGYVSRVLSNLPDQAQTVATTTTVQPIPLVNAAHKPTLAEFVRPTPATAQPVMVTVEKPIEPGQAHDGQGVPDKQKPASAYVYQTAYVYQRDSNANADDDTVTAGQPGLEGQPGVSAQPKPPKAPAINVYEDNAYSVMVYSR